MAERAQARRVTEAATGIGACVEFVLEPTGLYFADDPPRGSVLPDRDKWTCAFALMNKVQKGAAAVFTADRPGCIGASFYFGFNSLPTGATAVYLSSKERLKKNAGLAAAFYREVNPAAAAKPYLVFGRLDGIEDGTEVEVVNLWIDIAALAPLHTLANYDRAANDNVIMPFASGCQSIWTLPYKEKDREEPRVVAGSLDPTVRPFLPANVISLSTTAARLVEMAANIDDSFMGPC